MTGIAAAPRGIPQIEVTFDIDANGIVNVSAKDMATGKQQSITITSSTNLSEDEINKKIEEAKKFEEEDKKNKENIEIKNNADQLIYQTEKSLKDLEDKIDAADKKDVEEKLEALKKAAETDDYSDIKSKTDALTEAFYKISQKAYEQAAQSQQGNPNEGGDDVVDGDYEVVDED